MQRFVASLFPLCVLLSFCDPALCLGEVIYAINAGGEEHVDLHGIRYKRDPLFGKVGTASDYGKLLVIGRAHKNDHILYQTERYHTATFGYEIPVNKDGDYVLVLKFCEVYFDSPGRKVFDVVLNGQHTVVADLDIHAKVGRGVAHDEHIAFSIKGNKLRINGEESTHDGKIKVEFIKGYRDNPKINAIYVMRGTLDATPAAVAGSGVRSVFASKERRRRVVCAVRHVASGQLKVASSVELFVEVGFSFIRF
ncbi:hypothetical protein V5799_022180 [Amblyomma americanum]|uniref:Malectin domain-containing protein n=1 Tax=Amblyomma americanum TaxID=6943 RepID=A0AAQ4FL73_AMBAM